MCTLDNAHVESMAGLGLGFGGRPLVGMNPTQTLSAGLASVKLKAIKQANSSHIFFFITFQFQFIRHIDLVKELNVPTLYTVLLG